MAAKYKSVLTLNFQDKSFQFVLNIFLKSREFELPPLVKQLKSTVTKLHSTNDQVYLNLCIQCFWIE